MTAILLTACTKENSRPAPTNVQPDLDEYSDTYQEQLAIEFEAEARVPCPRDFMVPDCSAWKRAIVDYKFLRDRIRAAD